MSINAKTIVAGLLVAATVLSTAGAAQAKGWGHGGRGFGIALGVLGAVAAAGAYEATVCTRVPVYNRFGDYIGSRRVCD